MRNFGPLGNGHHHHLMAFGPPLCPSNGVGYGPHNGGNLTIGHFRIKLVQNGQILREFGPFARFEKFMENFLIFPEKFEPNQNQVMSLVRSEGAAEWPEFDGGWWRPKICKILFYFSEIFSKNLTRKFILLG